MPQLNRKISDSVVEAAVVGGKLDGKRIYISPDQGRYSTVDDDVYYAENITSWEGYYTVYRQAALSRGMVLTRLMQGYQQNLKKVPWSDWDRHTVVFVFGSRDGHRKLYDVVPEIVEISDTEKYRVYRVNDNDTLCGALALMDETNGGVGLGRLIDGYGRKPLKLEAPVDPRDLRFSFDVETRSQYVDFDAVATWVEERTRHLRQVMQQAAVDRMAYGSAQCYQSSELAGTPEAERTPSPECSSTSTDSSGSD